MKKILVTGASGFIGNHVINELIKKKYEVIATSTSTLKVSEMDWYKDAKFIPFDFKQFDVNKDYYLFFDKPDIIVHLAWEGLPNYKSLFHYEENLPRHYKFLKNLILNGAQDITVAGTCFEYGMQEGCLDEAIPTFPNNPYALAKDTLRKFLMELNKINEFNFKWVRLFYMYGKGQNPNSLFSQLDKAIFNKETSFNMSGGEQLRDYLSVEKVAENIVKIATQNKIIGIINCCSGKPASVKQLVEDYLKLKHAKIKLNLGYYPYPDYEPIAFWGSCAKMSKCSELKDF